MKPKALSRKDIVRGLERLDAMAREADKVVELAVYGGAALALSFDMRVTTRDVDAVVRGSADFARACAARIAEEEGWPEGWLNDGVKGFRSQNEQMRLMHEFQAADGKGLRVLVPSPQYLFAMKCMAMRPEGIDGSHDISDIEALAGIAEIPDAKSALELVESFYPSGRIPTKVRFGVEEIMERAAARRKGRRR
jgi:hypothetical protein